MKPTFKNCNQNQPSLFPFDFGNLVEEGHPARIINEIVDKLDISDIMFTYKGGGTSSYHPRMMLKIIIYGYLNNLYSCRKIAKAVKENVTFIWLSGEQFPDYRTINAFRGKRLKETINDIFKQVVLLLQSQGVVSLEEVFTDGTKIESVANRYTFVWKKSIENHKAKLESKIQTILAEIEQSINEDSTEIKKEGEKAAPSSTSNPSPTELNKQIEKLNEGLKKKKISRSIKSKANKLNKKLLPKLEEYNEKLDILGERGSYSKTDKDATFMRMKEDHMKNGQLKPAYNIQLSTEDNFITNYSIHQNPGDTTTLKEHLYLFYEKYGRYPGRMIADAGYGGLENYDFLEDKNIDNFVKYNYFYRETTKKFKVDISKVENLYYNEEGDYFICPMGQKMRPIQKSIKNTRTGYEYETITYQAENCGLCPLRGACHKQKGNRNIEVNKKLFKHKQTVRNNLNSKLGRELRGRRLSEVEQTFGQLKSNKGFKRFLLKGIPKISIELGLLALAHNFQKLSKCLIDNNLTERYSTFVDQIKIFCLVIRLMKLKNSLNSIKLLSKETKYFKYEKLKKAA